MVKVRRFFALLALTALPCATTFAVVGGSEVDLSTSAKVLAYGRALSASVLDGSNGGAEMLDMRWKRLPLTSHPALGFILIPKVREEGVACVRDLDFVSHAMKSGTPRQARACSVT